MESFGKKQAKPGLTEFSAVWAYNPVLKSGDPVEQLKQVKYMDLVASAIMLHNVADLTELLSDMAAEGLPVTKELVSRLSPYMREHLRRFGQFVLDMDNQPPPLEPKPLPSPSEIPM
jgi:hypothetical protein